MPPVDRGGRRRRPTRAIGVVGLAALLVGSPALDAQAPRGEPGRRGALGLFAESSWIQPGTPFTAALRLTLEPGWHTYWVNGGDAGFPLEVTWEVPDGFEAGPLAWPPPMLQPWPPFMSYGYEDELVLLVEITPSASIAPGTRAEITAGVDWLVCAEVCIAEQDRVSLSLPVRVDEPSPSATAARIVEAARERLPWRAAAPAVRAWLAEDGYVLEVETSDGALPAPYFFADDMTWIEHAAPQQVLTRAGLVRLGMQASELAEAPAHELSGILVADVGDRGSHAYQVSVGVEPPRELPPDENPFTSAAAVPTGGLGARAGPAAMITPPERRRAPGLLFTLSLAMLGAALLATAALTRTRP